MTTDPVDTPTRPCATCTAPLADGQDWCLECGSAQPGRLGGRPGWRAALTVVGACALLATGAGAAAYAALSSEAQRVAAAPPPPAAAPTVTPPPPAPAPPPAEETPEVEAPRSEPADVPEPEEPADDAIADDGGAAAGDPGAADEGTGTDEEEPAADEPIELFADAASTYDPERRGGNAVGDPADVVDGRDDTAWEAPVGPDGEVRIGLALSLEQSQALDRVAFQVDTPGFTVEVYGSRASKLPPDVLDARWESVDALKDVGVREDVDLKGKYRHVLLWITAQPADSKVAIAEIQLFD